MPTKPHHKMQQERFKGFGRFLISAGDHLSMKTIQMLATLMEFKPAFKDRLESSELPGLLFLQELESMGKISSKDISFLTDALEDDAINLCGIKEEVTKLFNVNCSRNDETSSSNESANSGLEVTLYSTNKALCTKMNTPRHVCSWTPISRALNSKSDDTIPSLKVVLVDITLLRNRSPLVITVFTVQDAECFSLRVLIDEDTLSTLHLCAGSVIELLHFVAKRSHPDKNHCYLLSQSGSNVKELDQNGSLHQLGNQLPIFRKYQIKGICTYLEVCTFSACNRPQCFEKKLVDDATCDDGLLCCRCGDQYSRGSSVITKGFFVKLTIDDGTSYETFERVRIIFKREIQRVLKEAERTFQDDQELQHEFSNLVNDRNVRAIVKPDTPYEVIEDLVLLRRQNSKLQCELFLPGLANAGQIPAIENG